MCHIFQLARRGKPKAAATASYRFTSGTTPFALKRAISSSKVWDYLTWALEVKLRKLAQTFSHNLSVILQIRFFLAINPSLTILYSFPTDQSSQVTLARR